MSVFDLGAKQAPWHLWGNTQVVQVNPTLSGTEPAQDNNTTLVRVQYGRPDSWSWLFACRILSGGTPTDVGEAAQLAVTYSLLVGLGRSAVRLPEFAVLRLEWPNGALVPSDRMVYATSTPAFSTWPPPAGEPPPRITNFVGQDFTIVAKASYVTDVAVGPVVPLQVEISGHVTPATVDKPGEK